MKALPSRMGSVPLKERLQKDPLPTFRHVRLLQKDGCQEAGPHQTLTLLSP